jgi:hypothetical protein
MAESAIFSASAKVNKGVALVCAKAAVWQSSRKQNSIRLVFISSFGFGGNSKHKNYLLEKVSLPGHVYRGRIRFLVLPIQ